MIINSSIMIFICFKEIFSWNSVASIIFLTAVLFEKPSYSSQLYLNKRSLNRTFENTSISYKVDNTLKSNLTNNFNSNSYNSSSLTKSVKFINESSILKPTDITIKSVEHNILSLSNQTLLSTVLSTTKDPNNLNSISDTTVGAISNTSLIVRLNSSIFSSLPPSQNRTNVPLTSTNITLTTVPTNETSTTNSSGDENGQLHAFHYILIVCAVIAVILLIAYGIYHMYRKEQVRRLRLQLMPVYNFDPTESDDWENNLLEEEFTLRSRERDKTTVVTAGAVIDVTESVASPSKGSPVPITFL